MTPDPEQEKAIEQIVNEPTKAALNASQFGTGKTLVAVEVGLRLDAEIVLIVCPLFTKLSWKDTILEQAPDANVRMIDSKVAGKKAMQALMDKEPGWYIVGREYFASKSVADKFIKIAPSIDLLAYDECAKWANRKSRGFAHMRKIKPKFKLAMSATPWANKFENIWTICRWLWPDQIPRSFWAWVAEWCETKEDYFAGVVVQGEKTRGAFVNTLPCYVRIEKDFGEIEKVRIKVALSAAERRIYDKFNKTMIIWLNENPLVAKLPIDKRTRLRQMTLGEVFYDEELDTINFDPNMKSTKYDTLVDLIHEYAEPMLILTESQKFARVVTERLKRDGFRAEEWSGKVSESERNAIKARYINGETDFIVAVIRSIGEGTDGLQARSRIMVWLSRDESGYHTEQAFRRLYRRGQEKQVISIDIEAIDTYDTGVLNSGIARALAHNESLKKEAGDRVQVEN